MTIPKFKSKWEYEEEDTRRYRKAKEDAQRRRKAKQIAEGFKCNFDGCGMKFETQAELKDHTNQHNEECWRQMKCNQSNCGKKVRFSYPETIVINHFDISV